MCVRLLSVPVSWLNDVSDIEISQSDDDNDADADGVQRLYAHAWHDSHDEILLFRAPCDGRSCVWRPPGQPHAETRVYYFIVLLLLLCFHCKGHGTVYVHSCTQTPSVHMRRLQYVLAIKRVDLSNHVTTEREGGCCRRKVFVCQTYTGNAGGS